MKNTDAKKIAKESKSSFYYAFSLLPKSKREAMNIVYSFCRKTDDIVDKENEDTYKKQEKLIEWKNLFKESLHAKTNSSLLNQLSSVINKFKISSKPFFDLIEGMEMDLHKIRYNSFEELYSYCYKAASTVGLITIEIFGYTEEETKDFAINLGVALQLTNIIRDIKEDAQKSRIYLPKSDLKKFDYNEEDIFSNIYNKKFINLMQYEIERAKKYFQRAEQSLNKAEEKNMYPAIAMGEIYYKLLKKIEKANYNIFEHRIRINKFEKFYIAFKILLKYKLIYR